MFDGIKKLFKLDRPVTRAEYPREKFGNWEFVEVDHGVIARIYTTPVMEQTFYGKDADKLARAWVHENMFTVAKRS